MYRNITICLDLTSKDQTLIKYAAWLNERLKPKSVTLLHVARISYLPESLREKYMTESAVAKLTRSIRRELASYVDEIEHFNPQIEVRDGHPKADILAWSEKNDTDLLVLGKGAKAKGAGVLARAFLRRADCGILLVPDGAETTVKRILCPTDFSKSSRHALDVACFWGERLKAKSLEILNFYYPPAYHYSRMSRFGDVFDWTYAEIVQDLKEDAELRLGKLSTRETVADSGLFVATVVEEGVDMVATILERISENGSDLCVLGHDKRQLLESLFFGDLAEKLIYRIRIPFLIHNYE